MNTGKRMYMRIRAMFSSDRRGADGVASEELLAVMPFAKFLDTALDRLPESFHFKGRVERGVRCTTMHDHLVPSHAAWMCACRGVPEP